MDAFLDRLRAAQTRTGSTLCVGLDPDAERLPDLLRGVPPGAALEAFCADVVRTTADVACAYKPNLAFFEAHGAVGWAALEGVIAAVRLHAPHALVVLDGKRGDVGNSARFYAAAAFDRIGGDAATVVAYQGHDAVAPFLAYPGRCAFVLARTSNPGAADFQHLDAGGAPLYRRVVESALGWAPTDGGTVGFVAGATDPAALAEIRRLAPEAPLLVPGVGTQGGNLGPVTKANGGGPLLVNVGRDVLYASAGPDFAEAAGDAARAWAKRLPA